MLARPATAQSDPSAARALFEEARNLMKAGQYDAACPKLEAAKQLYAGPGVLLNLGDCYEKMGRTASGWAEFGDAMSAAVAAGRTDYEAEARRRRAALETRVSRLAIHVETDEADLVVNRDGVAVDRATLGVAVPVDPGQHRVSAEVSGHPLWSVSVSITAAGETVTVEVPELHAPAPQDHDAHGPVVHAAPVTGTSPPSPAAITPGAGAQRAPLRDSLWNTRRIAAASMAAAGLTGIAGSTVLLLTALSRYASARGEIGPSRVADGEDAVRLGDGASVAFAVGAAFVSGGAVLWLTGQKTPVNVGASGQEVFIRARF